ncbi:ribonuclease H-like domain-containing protein [Baffinella frigidus]|nr:ribonuclease H-like domain-containing protein [Cryptophyta sp. CCMP2293]
MMSLHRAPFLLATSLLLCRLFTASAFLAPGPLSAFRPLAMCGGRAGIRQAPRAGGLWGLRGRMCMAAAGVGSAQINNKILKVTVVENEASLSLCRAALSGQPLLALDCEGVNLGRRGEITLIQLATPDECFLLDVQDAPRAADVLAFAKEILEDGSVSKIIHDCKADSDALFHLLGIELKNVHDTQAWHIARYGAGHLSLNTVLGNYTIDSNVVRDSSVYKTNEAFWATRPLTDVMIEWASGDVKSLFRLREAQTSNSEEAVATLGAEASEANLQKMRECVVEEIIVPADEFGHFIGKAGANLRKLEERFQITICRSGAVFLVYAKDADLMQKAVDHMKQAKHPSKR